MRPNSSRRLRRSTPARPPHHEVKIGTIMAGGHNCSLRCLRSCARTRRSDTTISCVFHDFGLLPYMMTRFYTNHSFILAQCCVCAGIDVSPAHGACGPDPVRPGVWFVADVVSHGSAHHLSRSCRAEVVVCGPAPRGRRSNSLHRNLRAHPRGTFKLKHQS